MAFPKNGAAFPREHTSGMTAPVAPVKALAPPPAISAPAGMKAPEMPSIGSPAAKPPDAVVMAKGGASVSSKMGKPKVRPVSARVREENGM